MSMASTPVGLFLPAFYTQDLGLGMAAVGAILMLSRFWDVITDPVIGYFSDRTRTRIGRRKPWIIISVPLVMISIYNLFFPPRMSISCSCCCGSWSSGSAGPCSTSLITPGGAELSPDYVERTRVTGWRTVAGLLGTLLAIAIPAVSQVLFGWGGRSGETLYIIGIVALCLMPVVIFPAVAYVPEKSDFRTRSDEHLGRLEDHVG